MLRKLKYHEQKLLKKVDFLDWRRENNLHETAVVAKYGLSDREEYLKYHKVVAKIRRLTAHLSKCFDVKDPYRVMMTRALLKKLYDMGLVERAQDSLVDADKLTVTALCRRRLAIVLRNLKMCENLAQATSYVRQGHIRIGPQIMLDPAVLVTRKMEDFVTWTDDSKVREKVLRYNELADDYDMHN